MRRNKHGVSSGSALFATINTLLVNLMGKNGWNRITYSFSLCSFNAQRQLYEDVISTQQLPGISIHVLHTYHQESIKTEKESTTSFVSKACTRAFIRMR